MKHTQLTFSGNVLRVALSPDGATIASVVGSQGIDERLMVRDVTGRQAVEVWSGWRLETVAWMPDGRHVLIAGVGPDSPSRGIQIVPRFGGAPSRVAGLEEPYVTVSPDGTQIAGTSQDSSGFGVTALDGGPVRRLTLSGVRAVFALRWSPGGRQIAVLGLTPILFT